MALGRVAAAAASGPGTLAWVWAALRPDRVQGPGRAGGSLVWSVGDQQVCPRTRGHVGTGLHHRHVNSASGQAGVRVKSKAVGFRAGGPRDSWERLPAWHRQHPEVGAGSSPGTWPRRGDSDASVPSPRGTKRTQRSCEGRDGHGHPPAPTSLPLTHNGPQSQAGSELGGPCPPLGVLRRTLRGDPRLGPSSPGAWGRLWLCQGTAWGLRALGTLTLPGPAGVAGIGGAWTDALPDPRPRKSRKSRGGDRGLSSILPPAACVLADKEVLLCGPRQGAGRRGGWELGEALPGEGVDQCPPSCLWGWRPLLPQPGERGQGARGRGRDGSRLQGIIRGPGSRLEAAAPPTREPGCCGACELFTRAQLSLRGREDGSSPTTEKPDPTQGAAVALGHGSDKLRKSRRAGRCRGGPSQCQAALGGIRKGL